MPKYIDAEKLEKDGWLASRTYQQDAKTTVYEIKKMTDFPTVDVPDTNVGDTISRRAAIDLLESGKDKTAKSDIGGFYNTIIQNDIDKLRNLPAAQSDSKPGYWVVKEGTTAFWDICSNCGEKTIHRMPHFKYCPYCGRRMEA